MVFEDGDESNSLELGEVRYTPPEGERPTEIGTESMRCNHIFDLIAVVPAMKIATVLLGDPSAASAPAASVDFVNNNKEEEKEAEPEQKEEPAASPPSEIILIGAGSKSFGKLDANGKYQLVDWNGKWPKYKHSQNSLELFHKSYQRQNGRQFLRESVWILGKLVSSTIHCPCPQFTNIPFFPFSSISLHTSTQESKNHILYGMSILQKQHMRCQQHHG